VLWGWLAGEVFYSLFCVPVFFLTEPAEYLPLGVHLPELETEAVLDIDCCSVLLDGGIGSAQPLGDLGQLESQSARAGIEFNGAAGTIKSFI